MSKFKNFIKIMLKHKSSSSVFTKRNETNLFNDNFDVFVKFPITCALLFKYKILLYRSHSNINI